MNTALTTPETASPLLQALHTTYTLPFLELLFQAQTVHRQYHPQNVIQLATLANIKSGNCPEDCKYCPQSSRYNTGVETWDLPTVEDIKSQVQTAKANGSSRFCMGAAWRTPPSETHFQHVVELVKTVKAEGVEACVTLGMLTLDQAHRLKDAGLTAYNHNLDTSPEYYPEIISTRTYEDRLNTIKTVGDAGLQVCCGGILGMGETQQHRLELLEALLQLEHPPESVPINCLVPVAGTPMADNEPVDPIVLVRLIATTRIHLPKAKVRLSAGRLSLSEAEQALCFAAGANSIFSGEKLLTTPNPQANTDAMLFAKLGLTPTEPVLVHGV
jgi:biotin synthase